MKHHPVDQLLSVVARLRGPRGCPWDRQQTHRSLRYHAVEEVYELIDAIEAGDDDGLEEELGDLLLHVVLHSQIARERRAFDFQRVARRLVTKLVYRHPHVFGTHKLHSPEAVLAQWDALKAAEKHGRTSRHPSALNGIPRRLPALERAQKLWKKAVRANLVPRGSERRPKSGGCTPLTGLLQTRRKIGAQLFELARFCQERGWHAEDLLRSETKRRERAFRIAERRAAGKQSSARPSEQARAPG